MNETWGLEEELKWVETAEIVLKESLSSKEANLMKFHQISVRRAWILQGPTWSEVTSGSFRITELIVLCIQHSHRSQSLQNVTQGFTNQLLQASLAVKKVNMFAISRSAGRSKSQSSEEVKCPHLSFFQVCLLPGLFSSN